MRRSNDLPFNSLDQIYRSLWNVYVVQGILLGPLGNIKLSDPSGMELIAGDEVYEILSNCSRA